MKVLYIGQFDEPHRTENYVAHALKEHRVRLVYQSPINEDFRSLKRVARRFEPDVILFSKAEPVGVNDLMSWCREHKILTVCWVWDLYWGYRSRRPQQFRADLLFTTDGGHEEQFKKHGYNHIVLRQGVHEPEHVIYPSSPHSTDVAFVGGAGHKYGYRQELIDYLSRSYEDRFMRYSNVRGLDLNKLLSRVKVVVGDSYPSPNYWSNRVYEITGRGGFLLHPKTAGLDDEFTDGVHYISYDRNNLSNLGTTLDYWLSHDAEREDIRRRGFSHCGSHFTYTARVGRLLSYIRQRLQGLK